MVENISVLVIFSVISMIGIYVDGLKTKFNPSGLVVCMILAAALRTLDLLPSSSLTHDIIDDYLVPFGICAFLFGSNLKSILMHGSQMLTVFSVSAATVVVAALATNYFLDIGPYQQEVIAMLNASYIGGSANLVFMSKFLEFDYSQIFAALIAVDNIVMALYFVFIGFIGETRPEHPPATKINKIRWKQYIRAMIVIACITLPILYLFSFVGTHQYLKFVALTIVTILCTNLMPSLTSDIKEAHSMGNVFFMLFFCGIGTGVNFDIAGSVMRNLFLCASMMVSIHCILLYIIGRLIMKIDMEYLIITSNACLGGSSTSVAFAKSKHWHHLITTAAIMGVIGYSIANFISMILLYFL